MIALSTPGPISHHIPTSLGSYHLTSPPITLPYAGIKIVKWQSEESGLTVVWCDVDGPLVQGYFSTRTEVWDDKGVPHTLEHLVFLGSEKYKYKGVLDTISNRMFANGTNAWTSTTDTTYTVGTAGAEGFLGILPVYLDHVLYPTITDAGFVTEVYAINGNGEDSGVVLSEMQGRENGSSDLMALKLQRTIYNKNNGLRSETGGLMSALRELKVEEIRAYHAKTYLPHNITLIVTGRSLSPTALLTTLMEEVEPSIRAHGQNRGRKPEGWKRPWVESRSGENPPEIPIDLTEEVLFPEKDESIGEVMISWIGYKSNETEISLAISTVGEYLTDSAVSPLGRRFVEVDDPWTTDISFSASSESPSILTAYLSSVPTEHLTTLPTKFRDAMKEIVQEEGIDMKRMGAVLERQRLHLLDQLETDASDVLTETIIEDVLFGKEDGTELAGEFDLKDYETLAGWGERDWKDLINKYFNHAKAVTIIGRPSSALSDTLEKEVKDRLAETIAKLGPEGLAAAGKRVSDAQAENDKPIPGEILKKFNVPDVNGIDWIKVKSARSAGVAQEGVKGNKVQKRVDKDGTVLPLFVQFDHINSNFIEISIILFPSPSAPSSVLALLPIYIDSFFSLPVTRADGTQLSFEDVVTKLDEETLSYSIDIGSPLQEGLTLKIKVAKEKYKEAVAWLRDLLLGSTFSVDRLRISAGKALQNLPSEKRSGSGVAHAAYRHLVRGAESTNIAMNLLNRVDFLPAFIERLKEEPDAVVADFEAFRTGLVNPRSMRVSVKGDILSLHYPSQTWAENFEKFPTFDRSELIPVLLGSSVLSPVGEKPSKKLVLYGISSIESSFAYHVTKGPIGWTHPDQPALTVARSILNAMEGFLWKFIRGAGLAYGANIDQDHESGFIYYRVYKSPDTFLAFEAAKDLIDSIVDGKIKIDELTLESAKSSLAYNTAAKESTMSDAGFASFMNQVLRDLPQDHGRIALSQTKDITIPQVLESIRKYIQPIFSPSTSIAAVSTGLVKVDSTGERFEKVGYEVEKRSFGKDDDEDGEEGDESESESESGSASESEMSL